MPFRPLVLLILFSALAALYSPSATAEVRRCVTPSGQAIFTDRQCDAVGASERVPERNVSAAHARSGGCSRTLDDLVFEVKSAIDARDANRLAGVYHWPGQSSDSGYQIWERLDAIANRPLVDIVPIMGAAESSPESIGHSDAIDTAAPDGAAQTNNDAAVDPALYPQTTVRRTPIALRIEQTLGNTATPSRTVFGLTHYFGCWWVRF